MATLVKKAKQFKKIFSKEEKMVIILGSIVTLLAIAVGLIGLVYITSKILNWYIGWTAPTFGNALNKLVGALFEGWSFF